MLNELSTGNYALQGIRSTSEWSTMVVLEFSCGLCMWTRETQYCMA